MKNQGTVFQILAVFGNSIVYGCCQQSGGCNQAANRQHVGLRLGPYSFDEGLPLPAAAWYTVMAAATELVTGRQS